MKAVPAGSLLEYLQQIPDPRGRKGRRHEFTAMLATLVCAFLQGARGYSAIAQWIHSQDVRFWHELGYTRRPPKQGAFRKLLLKLSAGHFEQAVRNWAGHCLGEPVVEQGLDAVALDGKTLCGTLQSLERAIHLLSVLDQKTGYTLSQTRVDEHTNEAKAALELLCSLVLKGRVVTGDAIFCQREVCQEVLDHGGHYLFVVKDNQPTLKEAIAAEFTADFSPVNRRLHEQHLDVAETKTKGHGRLHSHRLEASTRLAGQFDWPGLEQVCRLTRTTRRGGKWTAETVYAVTSVPRSQADAAQLLSWWRGHWGIENRSHYVRDVTFQEDACRIRTGNAPQNFAALRNAVIACLRLAGNANIASALRACTWQTQRMLAMLGIFKK